MKRQNRSAQLFKIRFLIFWVTLIAYPPPQLAAVTSAKASVPSSALRRPDVTMLPSKEKRWALIIGVDKYEDENITQLRGAGNDAMALAKALTEHAGFGEDQVIVLTNDQQPGRQPTRKNILRYLSNLKGLIPRDGLLLVSFSGHGVERDGRAFLIPSDALFTDDIKLLQQTAVSVDEMKEDIKATGVQQVLIFLDACRNDPLSGKADSVNPLTNAYLSGFSFSVRNQEVVAFAILYSTSVGARAYEDSRRRQGYFTLALVEALAGKAADAGTGEVTLRNLVKYVESTVPAQVAINLGVSRRQKPFAVIEGYRADELVLSIGRRDRQVAQTPTVLGGESIFWREVEKSDTQGGYEAFLKAYPKGEYAAVAAFKLERLRERLSQATEYYKRGEALRFSNSREALINLNKAIELNPNYAEAYRVRGDIHTNNGSLTNNREGYELALADYNKAIELNPLDVESFNMRGITHNRKGDHGRAIADFSRAVEIDPNYTFAFSNRGDVYMAMGRFDLATVDYTVAINKMKTRPSVRLGLYYNDRGRAYLALKIYEQALADFNKAIELSPGYDPYYSRGQYYFAKQDYENALADYTKAIELISKWSSVPSLKYETHNFYNHRGLTHLAIRDYDKAIADFTKAIELYWSDATVYLNRARAFEAKGDVASAAADRKKAGEIGRTNKSN